MDRKANSTKGAWKQAGSWLSLLAVLCSLGSPGCRTCRIPRIDPTGERLFAGTTTIDPQLGQLPTPQPAFITPPAPPACGPGVSGHCKKQHIKLHTQKLCEGIKHEMGCAGDEGQLIVTPASVVAPVGSEVVVLAGLCGPERNFVARQPIEFALSQESVGNFVAVGEDGECVVTRLYRKQPKKATGGYAVGVSSASGETLTRGTPQPNDDILIGKGQTWLSVTSPSEGTSYVTVVAPNAKNWDQRRQTAVIQWVDAQWAFPNVAIVPSGKPTQLTTIVRRAGGTVPATGYTVRYEVTAGEPAGFAPRGETVVDVPVDAQGNATVTMQQLANNAGTTTVSVQILRPSFIGGATPLVIGQGWTSVTWSAPGLAVNVAGPQTVQTGLEANYRIAVSNPGDITSRDVVVTTQLPPTLRLVSSNPPPQVVANRLEWRLNDLDPKTVRNIDVKTTAIAGGDIRFRVNARSADGVQAEGEAASAVTQKSLNLVLTGPQTAGVNESVTFKIDLANRGNQPLRNVRLRATFPAGLVQDRGQPSPVEWAFGDLQPGEQAESRGITFFVRQEGPLCLTMEAIADGGEITSAQACVEAIVKQVSALQVAKAGPAEVPVGESATYTIEVTNTGNTPLTNVKIVDQYPAAMSPTAGTQGFAFEGGAIVWTIPELGPNVVVRRQVNCQAMKAEAAAVNRVVVTTNEKVTGEDAVTTRIVQPGPSFSPMRVPVPDLKGEQDKGNVNAAGELRLKVKASAETAKVGEAVTYFLEVHNDREVSDRQVRLRVTLPAELEYVGAQGRYTAKPVAPENRVIEVTPIAEMRRGEVLTVVELKLRATAAGKPRLQIEATSQRSPSSVKLENETTVYAK